ncbi:glycosyltransferase [Paraburkholderia xenovorans]
MNSKKARVGIVVVTFNSAEVFALAIESLLKTRSDTEFVVAVIDNASRPAERVAVQATFDNAVAQHGLQGKFFQQDKNLGFSGGNNVGIEYCLSDPAATHICLLNSDVIVTDHWLDYLVAADKDAIGPLTNASNNEQGIPIPYQLGDRNRLAEGSAALDMPALTEFAIRRREGWLGLTVDSDFLSYYCVLFSRKLIERVGTLDERFFPGAYEDDDHCVRILENGFTMHVARDVYIHHWGSASFGKLDVVEAQGFAAQNRKRFEEKHGRAWQDRTRLSVTAWMQDSLFAIASPKRFPIHLETHRLYATQMRTLVEGLEAYSAHLGGELARKQAEQFSDLRSLVMGRYVDEPASAHSVLPAISSIAADIEQYLSMDGEGVAPAITQRMAVRFESLARELDALVARTSEMAQALARLQAARAQDKPPGPMQRVINRLARAAQFPTSKVSRLVRGYELLQLMIAGNGILFFAPYPTRERERDGYFQRVKAIDSLFPSKHRVYCDVRGHVEARPFIERAAHNAWVLNISLMSANQCRVVALLARRFKRVYFHSVLRMPNPAAEAVLRVPGLKWILDVHGVVPEEFRMHNDFFSARIHDDCERMAAEKASRVIVVSQAMGDYLAHKYRELLRAKVIVLPIFALEEGSEAVRPYKDGRPTVIYAGGTQKWQNVPAMLNVVARALERADWWMYTPDIDVMRNAASPEVQAHPNFHVASATRAELNEVYQHCHFGFILRDDMVVNHVSCPTKLIEYLAFGIVPIVDTPNIGDFNTYGMRFVNVEDFARGLIPDAATRMEMAAHNRLICERLVEQKATGEKELIEALA